MLRLNAQGAPVWQGVPLDLSPKERAVLALLIQRRPHAVSKEDIFRHAWADDVAVSDDSLVRCIGKLRRRLPKVVIEAVYGFGYRLLPLEARINSRLLDVALGPEHVAETYLYATSLAARRTASGMGRAVRILRELAREHPDFAPARILLAQTIGAALNLGIAETIGVAIDEAWAQLRTADRLAPQAQGLTSTHALLCEMEWRFDEAGRLYAEALRSHPDSAELLQLYAWHLVATGHAAQAVAVLRTVMAKRPFATYARVVLARALAYVEQYEDALQEIGAACQADPDEPIAASMKMTMTAVCRPDAALIEPARRLSLLREVPPFARVCLPFVLARCGQPQPARDELRRLLADASASIGERVLLITTLVVLDELETAADIVVAAYQARYGGLAFVLRLPAHARLLKLPRVQEIHRQVFASLGPR